MTFPAVDTSVSTPLAAETYVTNGALRPVKTGSGQFSKGHEPATDCSKYPAKQMSGFHDVAP